MGVNFAAIAPHPPPNLPLQGLIVSHIFSWTRDEVYFNLFSCWLRAVIFPKRCLREFVCG